MSIVEFEKTSAIIKRRKKIERRKRARLSNRIAGKLQALVLEDEPTARDVERLIERLLRISRKPANVR